MFRQLENSSLDSGRPLNILINSEAFRSFRHLDAAGAAGSASSDFTLV